MRNINSDKHPVLFYLVYLLTERWLYFIPAMLLLISGVLASNFVDFPNKYIEIGAAIIVNLIMVILFGKAFSGDDSEYRKEEQRRRREEPSNKIKERH